jgi:hypothetical protein
MFTCIYQENSGIINIQNGKQYKQEWDGLCHGNDSDLNPECVQFSSMMRCQTFSFYYPSYFSVIPGKSRHSTWTRQLPKSFPACQSSYHVLLHNILLWQYRTTNKRDFKTDFNCGIKWNLISCLQILIPKSCTRKIKFIVSYEETSL